MVDGGEVEKEAETREGRIDPRLKAAGWTVRPYEPGFKEAPPDSCAVEEWPTSAGPADYALCAASSVLGVVEAKKMTVGAQGVLPQAQRYSQAIESARKYQGEYGVPFLYATNGEEIRFHDIRKALNRSRRVSSFHTPNALREQLERDFDAEFAALQAIPLHSGIRPYQVEACTAIEQTIADRHRKMLVTMATGTGKTLMTVNEVYRLMKSGVARRVLLALNEPNKVLEIDGLKTGTSESGMNLTMAKVKKLAINLPPIKEQSEIIQRVQKFLATSARLMQRIEVASRAVDASSQAVVAKAFRGELTLGTQEV